MNLHAIARGPVSAVNAEERCYLIQALGQQNVKGRIIASYAAAEPVSAQIQTLSPDELQAVDNALRTAHLRKFYLFAETYAGHKPQGQMRIRGQAGDYIMRAKDRTFWKIYQVAEDYAEAGWVCVGAALQIDVPDAVKASVPALMEAP